MRTILVLFFLAVGIVNSAIIDNKASPKTDWDDEDSMILTPSKPSSLPTKESETENGKRSPIISIIPLEKENSQEATEDDSNAVKEPAIQSSTESKEPAASQEQQDNSSTSSVEDNSSTEPKVTLVELSRVPLTFEIIPLLQPETEDKAEQKPTGIFPGHSGEALYKSKLFGHMGEHEQAESSEESSTSAASIMQTGDSGDTTTSDQNVPPMPLTYMIPPQKEAEVFWRDYPQDSSSTTTENSESVDKDYGYSSSVSTDSEAPMLTTRAPPPFIFMDPMLERIQVLQKAKRQSTEENESDGGEQVETTTTTISTQEDDTQEYSTPFHEETTPESVENESIYQVTTPPAPLNEDFVWNNQQQIMPKAGQPETIDYQPEAQPLPFRRDAPSIMDQYYSDYRPNSYPSISMMSPRPRPMIFPSQKPSRPLFIQSDSYWPQKYFDGYGRGGVDGSLSNNIDYPFIRYNDNYRPRNNIILPSSPVLNNIQDERPIRVGYDDDEFALGNYRSPNYYSYLPNSYVMNRRSNIPYRPFYPSSPTMDDDMYAPLYPHQHQFRRFRPQPQYYY